MEMIPDFEDIVGEKGMKNLERKGKVAEAKLLYIKVRILLYISVATVIFVQLYVYFKGTHTQIF